MKTAFQSGTPRWGVLAFQGVRIAGIIAWLLPCSAQSAIVFFSNDQSGFNNAMSVVENNKLLGTETFANSSLGTNSNVNPSPPVFTQGVANFPYSSGLSMPMTVQSNTLGGSASSISQGSSLLAVGPNSNRGNISPVITIANISTSLDWIFDAATEVDGVGLNPFSINSAGFADIVVTVYSPAQTLLGTLVFNADPAATQYLGIQATDGEIIGRINFYSPTFGRLPGGINASLYALPEPSRTLCLLAGMAFVLGGRDRIRGQRSLAHSTSGTR